MTLDEMLTCQMWPRWPVESECGQPAEWRFRSEATAGGWIYACTPCLRGHTANCQRLTTHPEPADG